MRFLALVLTFTQLSSAMAAMVVVPNDYNLIELPIGSVLRVKSETILQGSSHSLNLVDHSGSSDGNRVFYTCRMEYLPTPQRRILPANLDLYISNITKRDSSIPTPGYCWKGGVENTGASLILTVKSAKGFAADVICYQQTVWVPSHGEVCRFNEVPNVGDLSEIAFWADGDALKTIIGQPI